ncbi:hypothetical protein CVIRNUC_010706 [Coccomyxa viridis]|uniref:Uncharacterized protein n=1 Tax=Coccomyxa viridis TaxID=1274662 RepID=A0AAV1IJI0_9CHLO|nr:hypothetical protein CVIRNUC_010706 [Coccomyxa viridis]
MQGDCIRFTGAVLGGLRTSGSRTFRASGTAVVVAQEGTEDLLIAKSGRVLWDVQKAEALCGAPLLATDVSCFPGDAQRFATCGADSSLFIWQLDRPARKLTMHKIQVSTQSMQLVKLGPKPRQALSSVEALYCLSDIIVLAGGPEGRVLALDVQARTFTGEQPKSKGHRGRAADVLALVADHCLPDGITTLCPSSSPGMPIMAGTRAGDVFCLSLTKQGDFIQERVYLAPRGRINDLAVPHECSELVASCSHEELRLWDTRKRTELLRIHQPSLDFLCLALPKASSLCKDADVTHDGSSLLAGCSDGAIRLYGPQSGQLRRVLAGAHQAAVTALAIAADGQRLYSGDASGAFKAWRLGPQSHTMLATLKEHKGAIHRICLALDDREGATACADGSCILWDLQSFRRKTILAAGSSIADACYCTDQSQLITAGMLPICHLQHHLPRILLMHTGEVTRCVFTPDGHRLITADTHGTLCFWDIAAAVRQAQSLRTAQGGI